MSSFQLTARGFEETMSSMEHEWIGQLAGNFVQGSTPTRAFTRVAPAGFAPDLWVFSRGGLDIV